MVAFFGQITHREISDCSSVGNPISDVSPSGRGMATKTEKIEVEESRLTD
jgi:hypothetical protein